MVAGSPPYTLKLSPDVCAGARLSKPSMIPEGQPSQRFLRPPAAEEPLDTHSSEAPAWQPTGMASTTMEATQLGAALLPQINKGCVLLVVSGRRV